MAEDELTADDEEEQTYWYVCWGCEEGFYSHLPVPNATDVVCDRCWKEVHG